MNNTALWYREFGEPEQVLVAERAPYPAQAWQEAIGFYRAAGRGCKPLLS